MRPRTRAMRAMAALGSCSLGAIRWSPPTTCSWRPGHCCATACTARPLSGSGTVADLEAAWAIGQAFPDQDFSIVDRTSFAVMERWGVHRVTTFDDDFAVYRFGHDRTRAF